MARSKKIKRGIINKAKFNGKARNLLLKAGIKPTIFKIKTLRPLLVRRQFDEVDNLIEQWQQTP